MASFAKLNSQNIVEAVVIVADDVILDNGVESEDKGIEFLRTLYNEPNAIWLQTSYNTFGGFRPDGSVGFRKNYAGIGSRYIKTLDAFISPKPYNSWDLNRDTCLWEAPVPYPTDGDMYTWDEVTTSWKKEE
jgi:hypothetical protein